MDDDSDFPHEGRDARHHFLMYACRIDLGATVVDLCCHAHHFRNPDKDHLCGLMIPNAAPVLEPEPLPVAAFAVANQCQSKA